MGYLLKYYIFSNCFFLASNSSWEITPVSSSSLYFFSSSALLTGAALAFATSTFTASFLLKSLERFTKAMAYYNAEKDPRSSPQRSCWPRPSRFDARPVRWRSIHTWNHKSYRRYIREQSRHIPLQDSAHREPASALPHAFCRLP